MSSSWTTSLMARSHVVCVCMCVCVCVRACVWDSAAVPEEFSSTAFLALFLSAVTIECVCVLTVRQKGA